VSSDTPPTSAASQAAVLRRAWTDVAATVAPQLSGLPALLDERLAELEAGGTMDEPTLLAVAEQASQYALEQGAGELARALSKRLRRAIYEFLLALDAVNPAELANPPVAAVQPEPRTPVAFTPADVPGADEPAVAHAPVPLWEEAAPAPSVRQVYRVATRGVEPLVSPEPVLDEMDAAPEVAAEEFAGLESAAQVAEAQIVEAEGHSAEVVEATVWDDAPAEAVEAPVAADDGTPEQAAVWEGATAEAVQVPAAENDATESSWDDATGDALQVPAAENGATESAWDDATGEALQVPAAENDATESAWDDATGEALQVSAAENDATESAWDDATGEALQVSAAENDATESAWDDATGEALYDPADHISAPEQSVWVTPAAETLQGPVAEDDASESSSSEGAAEDAPAEQPDSRAPFLELAIAPADAPADEQTAAPHLHVVDPDAAAPAHLDAPNDAAEPAALHGAATNGPRPPRELLRVPRQFRRLPPLAAQHNNGHPTAVDTAPTTLPELVPTNPDHAGDDDAFGVPSVPWNLAQPTVPEPVPTPEAEVYEDPDEDMGVPFGPFALAGDAAADPPGDATPDLDLPKPPALAEEPLYPAATAAEADRLFITPLPTGDAPALWTPGPVERPAYDAAPPTPFPIAPMEGFHLTDPGALDFPAPPASANPFLTPADLPAAAAPPVPAPSAPEHAPVAEHDDTFAEAHGDHPHDLHDDGSWGVRQSPRAQLLAERMAQKRREEAARAAFQAASVVEDERDRARGKKRRGVDDATPDLPNARRLLDEHLRKKRGAEAGALLQRLAQELGGREIADLALDSGDRCRALGQSRSATNCYLAAWRADPLYETPLWRLSDICLNDQEIELAVGYLERIAELMRSRGDDEGAIGVYRKIAMIAPERQDVRDVIRLAKTTGRLDG
jgi:hypothetical protein